MELDFWFSWSLLTWVVQSVVQSGGRPSGFHRRSWHKQAVLWERCRPTSVICDFTEGRIWEITTSWATIQRTVTLFFKKMFIYFWERERGRGRDRGGHRIWNRLQAPSCQHRARYGARTHGPWDHDLRRSWTLNRQSHPSTPENN